MECTLGQSTRGDREHGVYAGRQLPQAGNEHLSVLFLLWHCRLSLDCMSALNCRPRGKITQTWGEVIPTEKRGGDREGGGLCSVQADNCPGRAMNNYHPPLPPAAAAYMLPKIIPPLNEDNMSCDAFIVMLPVVNYIAVYTI